MQGIEKTTGDVTYYTSLVATGGRLRGQTMCGLLQSVWGALECNYFAHHKDVHWTTCILGYTLQFALSLSVYELTLGNVEGTRSSRVCLPGQRPSRLPSLWQPSMSFLGNVEQEEGEMGFKLQVQVIHEPSHFYEQLLNRSVTAKKVKFLPFSSLQCGIVSSLNPASCPLCTVPWSWAEGG